MHNRFFSLVTAVVVLASTAFAEDLEITTRPDAIYVEHMDGNITAMDRVFFHIVVHNNSKNPIAIDWIRFDLTNSDGINLSGQYSGQALMNLFDSAIDRHRIEPTPKKTLDLYPDQRKAISDIFFDCPDGFIGETVVVEVQYQIGGKPQTSKISTSLKRMPAFVGQLPFEGVWYVQNEHGYLDLHKRYLAEAFAYDFIQIGENGKSYKEDGAQNSNYYAYGRKILAAKDGTVVFVRTDIVENEPGRTNINTPGGNVVVIDHGENQFGYYAHLRPNSISVKVGAKVKAGDPIGEAGNSGESLEPGLHFHVMTNADPNMADGIPVMFSTWKGLSYGAFPVDRELGLLPKGEFVQP